MTKRGAGPKPELRMVIDIRILEHLGLKMYNSLPAVVSEYIANSWDAGATEVNVSVPETEIDDTSVLTIEDNGCGMTAKELNDKFLVIGRQRRRAEGTDALEVNGKERKVMGRKGLGKIAGFGVAGIVDVITRRDGRFVRFRMDYDAIYETLEAEDARDIKTTYDPVVIDWGNTNEPNGTAIVLCRLKRERAIRLDELRRGLATHFSVLGTDFTVKVNNRAIAPGDRLLQKKCQFVWEFENVPIAEGNVNVVSGWIGTMRDTIPAGEERGVIVMTRGSSYRKRRPTT